MTHNAAADPRLELARCLDGLEHEARVNQNRHYGPPHDQMRDYLRSTLLDPGAFDTEALVMLDGDLARIRRDDGLVDAPVVWDRLRVAIAQWCSTLPGTAIATGSATEGPGCSCGAGRTPA